MGPIGLMGLMGGSEKKAEYWEPCGILRTHADWGEDIKNPRGLAAGLIKKEGDGFLMDRMDRMDGMDWMDGVSRISDFKAQISEIREDFSLRSK